MIGEGRSVTVLPEAVATDGRGGAVVFQVIGEGCGDTVLPKAVATDSRGGAVVSEVVGKGRREGERNIIP